MKFKVGDKVTVKKDLKTGWYDDEMVIPEMLWLAGKTVEVEAVPSEGSIYVSESAWRWTPSMFQEKPSEITLEIGYRYLTDTVVQTSSQTVTDNDFAYEKACEQFLEEWETNYGSAEKINICFVREAFDNA